MIENEEQYHATMRAYSLFDEALSSVSGNTFDDRIHPALRQAQVESLKEMRDELLAQIKNYNDRKAKAIAEEREASQWSDGKQQVLDAILELWQDHKEMSLARLLYPLLSSIARQKSESNLFAISDASFVMELYRYYDIPYIEREE